MTMRSMDFAPFIEQAWADHGDAPEAVAQRLEAFTVHEASQVAPVVRLAVHVFAVHLGAVERGVALLGRLPHDPAVARGIATLRLVGGADDALARLGVEDCIVALSIASSAWIDRGDRAPAIDALRRAMELAAPGLPDGSPAIRALATGGNNLSAALEELPGRDDAESRAMVEAAELALRYWQQAGTWLEHERAEYRLAASLLAAGRAGEALPVAQRCLAVCSAHDAPPFERFFAHALLAFIGRAVGDAAGFDADRAAALACLEQVPPGERHWCERDRARLA